MVREKRLKRVAGRAVLMLAVACMVLLTGCGVQQAQDAPEIPEAAAPAVTVVPRTTKPRHETPTTPDEPSPRVIPESAIATAIDVFMDYEQVIGAVVETDDDRSDVLWLIVQVSRGTTGDDAKEHADSLLRLLATFVAIESESFSRGPTKDDYGDLWDAYTAYIAVGTGPDNFLARGAMAKGTSIISWGR